MFSAFSPSPSVNAVCYPAIKPQHLETSGSYIRSLLMDHTSVFNTVPTACFHHRQLQQQVAAPSLSGSQICGCGLNAIERLPGMLDQHYYVKIHSDLPLIIGLYLHGPTDVASALQTSGICLVLFCFLRGGTEKEQRTSVTLYYTETWSSVDLPDTTLHLPASP